MDALPTGYRTLGVVTAWLDMRHLHVNVPRLLRLVDRAELSPVARAYWETARSVAHVFHIVSDAARARFPAAALTGIPRG